MHGLECYYFESKMAAHKGHFWLLFTRQSGGHHVLALAHCCHAKPIHSACNRHTVALACCCHAKPIHGACNRHTAQVSLQAFLVRSTTIVLHNRTLTWRDLSHARSILAVKSMWACYMANNILVVLTHVQLKSFYRLSTCDV